MYRLRTRSRHYGDLSRWEYLTKGDYNLKHPSGHMYVVRGVSAKRGGAWVTRYYAAVLIGAQPPRGISPSGAIIPDVDPPALYKTPQAAARAASLHMKRWRT